MTGATLQCKPDPDGKDPCETIRDQIRSIVFQTKDECGERGLRERFMDQIYGSSGPGTAGWDGHDIAITQLKNRIRKLIKDYNDKGCGNDGGTPIGADAAAWFNRPNPKPSEWKGGPAPTSSSTSRSILDWDHWKEATGLSGGALALYLIVSEGSRLFPPRNLIPAP
ncbi:MAG: hypothetical protein ACTHL8_06575 [Burkholderiaceae bacterium]